jgi:tRNA-dihydrouridine synthase 1
MAASTFLEESQKKEVPVVVPDGKKSKLLSNTTTITTSGGGSSSTTTRNMKNTSPMPRDWLVQLLQKYNNNNNNSNSHDGILSNKALVVAPMVDQSDLPFRLLCRRYGANLCYTPMIHARMFVNNEQGYRTKFWKKQVENDDRPLIVQFAGGDPSILARAAKIVQGQCDAIDLNCGCPQSIAKRGNYGAYLLEKEELLLQCIRSVRQAVPDTPITVKVRLLPTTTTDDTTTTSATTTTTASRSSSSISASISIYLKLIEAGVSLITVHGRNRFQKGTFMGSADWYAIQQIVQACGPYVPIIANGSCASLQDVQECLRVTGADGKLRECNIIY